MNVGLFDNESVVRIHRYNSLFDFDVVLPSLIKDELMCFGNLVSMIF